MSEFESWLRNKIKFTAWMLGITIGVYITYSILKKIFK